MSILADRSKPFTLNFNIRILGSGVIPSDDICVNINNFIFALKEFLLKKLEGLVLIKFKDDNVYIVVEWSKYTERYYGIIYGDNSDYRTIYAEFDTLDNIHRLQHLYFIYREDDLVFHVNIHSFNISDKDVIINYGIE